MQVLLLLSFANGMPPADDSPLERGFSLSIAGEHITTTYLVSEALPGPFLLLLGHCTCAKQVHTRAANAGSGLIAFALTVALVQQGVRGAIEANVKTGGTLFEIDHVSVLAPPCNFYIMSRRKHALKCSWRP